MSYWICAKCKSENTPSSNSCWKCFAPKDFNENSFNRKNEQNSSEKTKFSSKNSPNYWVCPKCNEQVFYLAQFCFVCFTRKPDDISKKSNTFDNTNRDKESLNDKLICACSCCGLKIRILFLPGRHEIACPNCAQEFDVFIMNDRSIHLVKKIAIPKILNPKLPWYEVLEVEANSSSEEIKAAYRKLMKEYHPDKVATLGKDLQTLAERKTKEISEAYEIAMKNKK